MNFHCSEFRKRFDGRWIVILGHSNGNLSLSKWNILRQIGKKWEKNLLTLTHARLTTHHVSNHDYLHSISLNIGWTIKLKWLFNGKLSELANFLLRLSDSVTLFFIEYFYIFNINRFDSNSETVPFGVLMNKEF